VFSENGFIGTLGKMEKLPKFAVNQFAKFAGHLFSKTF